MPGACVGGYFVSEQPPSENQDVQAHAPQQGIDPDMPAGAIVVTVFLAATILVFWFGMFFLNLARSG